MNILITSGILSPEIGGPSTYVPEIISRLVPNYSFKILTYTNNPRAIIGAEIISIPKNGSFVTRQFRLFKAIFQYRHWLDVIYTQDPLIMGLTSGLAGRIIGKKVVVRYGGDPSWEAAFGQGRTKKPLVDFLQQADGGIKSQLDVFLTRISFHLIDRIISNSQFLKDVVHKYYGVSNSKISVIHNAIELKSPPKKLSTAKKEYTALSFGRLVSWKKYDEIIEAVSRINKRGKISVKLIIFGDGPEREMLAKFNFGFLELLPGKSHQEALEYLRRADVYILNSLYEGSPNQVIEAFSVGTPVVATDIPGTNEVAINNQTALTVKPSDTDALSLAVERLLQNPQLAQKLVNNGLTLLKEEFTWINALKQLKSILAK